LCREEFARVKSCTLRTDAGQGFSGVVTVWRGWTIGRGDFGGRNPGVSGGIHFRETVQAAVWWSERFQETGR
jgi:hypothetical protein